MSMRGWRKQPGEAHHHVGHWGGSSSSYNRKPPLSIWQPTVPRWEKMFCTKVGSVPWPKLVETKKYLYLHGNVMNWDDSACKEAFDNAKSRFWAAINGLPCNISLPDPDIYIDEIDWNSTIDPELVLDLERGVWIPSEEDEEVVIFGSAFYLSQYFSGPGWGEAEAKPTDFLSDAQVNLHENNIEDSVEQLRGMTLHENNMDEAAKEYEWPNWRNDSGGWNQREHYHAATYKSGKGRAGWIRGKWDAFKRRGENMSWYKTPAFHHGGEYHMNRGRRNNRGGRRGTFAYVPCGDNISDAAAKNP